MATARVPSLNQLTSDERKQAASSVVNQASKIGISENQLRLAAQSPEQAAKLLATLKDAGLKRAQAQAEQIKKDTGREVSPEEINLAAEKGAARIKALLDMSRQLYGQQ
jgi:hypothetical protein